MAHKTKEQKVLASYMEVWILFILRTCTDKDNPMSRKELVERVTRLTGLGDESLREGKATNSIERTIYRRLDELEAMGYEFDEGRRYGMAGEVFFRTMGGRLRVTDDRSPRYYFEPILDNADVSVICAAIESNRYLSVEEKEYLIKRENAACSYHDGEELSKLPRKPEKKKHGHIPPSMDSVTLKKIDTLQYAIRKRLMIKIVPGTYYVENGKIVFGPKRERESFLNPYALICQNGQYYIIVTHKGYDNPTHYRVDRLYSVDLIRDEDRKGSPYVRREDIPARLTRFFNGRKFDSVKYTSTYPLMAYKGEKGIEKCRFYCRAAAATVAIDYFGIGDSVKMEKTEDEDRVLFSVLADYENVRLFCIQQYMIVTPVFPDKLRKDVRDCLQEAVERMSDL